VRILLGRGKALDFDPRAADGRGERFQIRRSCNDPKLLLREAVGRRRRKGERNDKGDRADDSTNVS
jgi:hypothetical protein